MGNEAVYSEDQLQEKLFEQRESIIEFLHMIANSTDRIAPEDVESFEFAVNMLNIAADGIAMQADLEEDIESMIEDHLRSAHKMWTQGVQ